MSTGVLLMAHGSPESLDQMEAYLNHVMTRHKPTPEFVKEMQERYETFGGRSPLLDITRRQASALQEKLGIPVHVGMRHWDPFIADVVAEMNYDRIIGLALAPHYGAAYHKTLQATGKEFVRIDDWHQEPKFLDAWAEKIDGPGPILFTAHSVPVRAAEPYRGQIRETVDGILERIPKVEWDLAWQSRSPGPGEWLEPNVDMVLRRKKWKSVLVVPVSFVTDHAEVLYDIDVLHRATADELGMSYRRTEMLNDSPLLIETLAEVVRRVL